MRRRSAAALLALAAAAPLAAQTPIGFGQTVTGTLAAGDLVAGDDTYYDEYVFAARHGERATVILRSDDFDAYLSLGQRQDGDWLLLDGNDDGGGGTDSRVDAVIAGDGTFVIRANTLSAGESGRYTLSLESGAPPAPAPAPTTVALRPGQSVTGILGAGDALALDDSYYDLYSLSGDPGEPVTITLRSDDFDAWLTVGRLEGDVWQETDSDDDGAGGTDARLVTGLPPSGLLLIRANTLVAGENGGYTLTIAGGSGAAPASGAAPDACAPTPSAYAADAPWYVESRPISVLGSHWVKYGLPRVLDADEVVQAAEFLFVPLFVERAARPPYEVLYAPVRSGCEFQPYVVDGG